MFLQASPEVNIALVPQKQKDRGIFEWDFGLSLKISTIVFVEEHHVCLQCKLNRQKQKATVRL